MCLWGLASSHPPQRSRWLRLVALLAVLAATLVVRLPTAHATMGVDDYPKRLKHAGLDALVDPWLFYNRECTSFVAWRLNNDAGAPFTNYYLGEHWGDASNWRHAANQAGVTVNDIPAVGAIAWWRAGSAGSSRGHVAWVESVSGSSIEIEEYNYATSGGYGTRTIYSGDSVWPSAFIHIGDISLRSDKRPTVTGTPQVGRRMTATRGTWKPTGATFTYQWLAGGVEIPGATHKVFTPRASQVADSIQVRVTATKPGLDPASTVSSATAKVKRGVFAPGKDPGIAGTAQVGVQLRAKSGSWTPTGRYSYQWFAGHDPIAGATKPVFTPPATKLGQPIRVRVTAHRRGYRPARGASEPTAEVRPGVFANAAPPSVDGLPQVGQPLSADVGEWTPKGKARYQWLVDGSAVDGATARTYKPVAADLHAKVAVQVTVERAGYRTAAASSAPTDAVAPGSFVNTRDPSVDGTPQVGVRLTVDPGDWTPRASFDYQWLVGGQPVTGAHGTTFRPRPQDVGQPVAVRVTASRTAYVTALVTTAPTGEVAPGVIKNTAPPAIAGKGFVGDRLVASAGSWSQQPDHVGYQWRRDGKPIAGATTALYTPRRADAGHKLSVRVTVGADGYRTTSLIAAPVRALFGAAEFARQPVLRGRSVVGSTLTVRPGSVTPSRSSTLSYQWFRGSTAIHGATDRSYLLRSRDTGHRLWARVTITAPDWASASRRSTASAVVRAR